MVIVFNVYNTVQCCLRSLKCEVYSREISDLEGLEVYNSVDKVSGYSASC